jgi:hypothetical protein
MADCAAAGKDSRCLHLFCSSLFCVCFGMIFMILIADYIHDMCAYMHTERERERERERYKHDKYMHVHMNTEGARSKMKLDTGHTYLTHTDTHTYIHRKAELDTYYLHAYIHTQRKKRKK